MVRWIKHATSNSSSVISAWTTSQLLQSVLISQRKTELNDIKPASLITALLARDSTAGDHFLKCLGKWRYHLNHKSCQQRRTPNPLSSGHLSIPELTLNLTYACIPIRVSLKFNIGCGFMLKTVAYIEYVGI